MKVIVLYKYSLDNANEKIFGTSEMKLRDLPKI